jgi:hypothetical protein
LAERTFPPGESQSRHTAEVPQRSLIQRHDALAKMKQYTDFNDLATKSLLGSEWGQAL